MAGSTMIIESWLNEAAAPAERGRIFGRYMLVNLVASTAGQLAIGLGGAKGFEPFAASPSWAAWRCCRPPSAAGRHPSH
jgi:hypothetical protein